MRWTPLTDSGQYDSDTSPLQVLKIFNRLGWAVQARWQYGSESQLVVPCVFLCLWWWSVGPQTNGMMSGTQYVAANGPAWASPQIIRLTISVQAGLCLWGPSRYSVYDLILGPTRLVQLRSKMTDIFTSFFFFLNPKVFICHHETSQNTKLLSMELLFLQSNFFYYIISNVNERN